MAETPEPQSNATNNQKNKSNVHIESDTTCVHGHTTFSQFLASPAYANAAYLKADSFLNHQRVTQCNCTLT